MKSEEFERLMAPPSGDSRAQVLLWNTLRSCFGGTVARGGNKRTLEEAKELLASSDWSDYVSHMSREFLAGLRRALAALQDMQSRVDEMGAEFLHQLHQALSNRQSTSQR